MRTAAMMIVTAGCAAMATGWAYFLIALVLSAAESELASFLIPLSVTFAAIFGTLGHSRRGGPAPDRGPGSGWPLPWSAFWPSS